jgi:hypothetical protein
MHVISRTADARVRDVLRLQRPGGGVSSHRIEVRHVVEQRAAFDEVVEVDAVGGRLRG